MNEPPRWSLTVTSGEVIIIALTELTWNSLTFDKKYETAFVLLRTSLLFP